MRLTVFAHITVAAMSSSIRGLQYLRALVDMRLTVLAHTMVAAMCPSSKAPAQY